MSRASRLGIGAATFGIAAMGIGAAFRAGLFRKRPTPGNAEHAAPDLAPSQPHPVAGSRAPDAFRPDPTAAVPPSERNGLRPATGPAPSLVSDRGALRSLPHYILFDSNPSLVLDRGALRS